MNDRIATLKQLVDASSYPLDESVIAEAIIVRSMARRLVPEIAFRVPAPRRPVRSFRPHRSARSFRLSRADRPPSHARAGAAVRVRRPVML